MNAQDPPDLEAVEATIQEARDAQDEIRRVAPDAINPAEESDQASDQHPDQASTDQASADVPTKADTDVTEVPRGPRAESDEPG